MGTIFTTFNDIVVAEEFIKKILELKLAKCANIYPIKSVYTWNKKIVKENEIAVILKTTTLKLQKLEEFLEKNHPYKIPIIETIKVDRINNKYLKWLNKEE